MLPNLSISISMSDRRKPYPFDVFESQWQTRWDDQKTYRTPNPGDSDFDATKPKFFVLDMFPYPSGAGLHVGHPEGYTATDIIGRYKRMNGFNVLHPMGWDAFGLPAEQYAIKTGQHPRITTEQNIDNFRRQLKSLGFAYDWDREVNTTDPGYVKWTQWIFLQLYNSYFCEDENKAKPVSELEAKGWTREQIDAVRLAYVSEAPVNWSPDLGTVLANEEIEEWKAKGHIVERRPLRQWMLRITKYAQRLIDDLDPLDWPESIKLLQKNWIGKSTGAEVAFDIDGHEVTVFTTRPDTLFGATYMVLAPEHPLVAQITTPDKADEVAAYQKSCANKSDLERGDMNKNKSGIFTGAYATNPVNDEKIPVWIADYVMMGYGTGAIMAVPAHDERDFEFATKFELPIVQVVATKNAEGENSRSAGSLPAVASSRRSVPPVESGKGYLDPSVELNTHRRKLPHWQQDGSLVFLTWRLDDSIPQDKLDAWKEERQAWLDAHNQPLSSADEQEYHELFSSKLDAWLDAGYGSCILKNPEIAKIVTNALHHFDGERYILDSFVVMPNHVHVLVQLESESALESVMHSWKSFTAHEINKAQNSEGRVWQAEYFDRIVRDDAHLANLREYIAKNPVMAGLSASEFVLHRSQPSTGGTPALLDQATPGHGIAVNSGFLDGLPTNEAKSKIISWLVENGKGTAKTNFKLRDWLFSRQRYWGEPFPILWENGKHHAAPESDLPILQPELEDFKPTGSPEGPLAKATDWIAYSETAKRETNTMPQWAGSCWYYLRYCDPKNTERFISKEVEDYWSGQSDSGSSASQPNNSSPSTDNSSPQGFVDLYVGGTEHAVLHLLYARFWHKVLHDLGHLSTSEPFQRLVNQGLILGEDGQKMSKSTGNVVNPDDVVREYGADSLRLYEMFMGPLEQVKPWQMKGVEGVSRFLARVWRVAFETNQEGEWAPTGKLVEASDDTAKTLRKIVHETIKKVGDDIEKLSFNTAISQMMVCTNAFTNAEKIPVSLFVEFLRVLNPFAPHLSEEINARIASTFDSVSSDMLSEQTWPTVIEEYLIESEVEIVIQVNGKLRDKLTVAIDASKEDLEALALASDKVKAHTDGLTVRKVIVVPGRLVNIVAN